MSSALSTKEKLTTIDIIENVLKKLNDSPLVLLFLLIALWLVITKLRLVFQGSHENGEGKRFQYHVDMRPHDNNEAESKSAKISDKKIKSIPNKVNKGVRKRKR